MLFQSQGLGLLKNTVVIPIPVITQIAITRSVITQDANTIVSFRVTGLVEGDTAFIEILGQKYIQQATSKNYLDFTATIEGSDLSVFTNATIRVVAFNAGYVVTDETLRLTVKPAMSRAAGKGKRSLDIDPGHDELELLQAMLGDKFVNHGLDKIISDLQIQRIMDPENYGEYPGIRIHGGTWIGSDIAEEVDESGAFIDSFGKYVNLEIYVMENQEVKYGGKIYRGTRILTLVRDILIRMISENMDYPQKADDRIKAKFTDIQFDFIDINTEMWITDHLGQPDAIGLILSLSIAYEKKRL